MEEKKLILSWCDEKEIKIIEPAVILEGYEVINLASFEELMKYSTNPAIKAIFLNPSFLRIEKIMEIKEKFSVPVIVTLKKKDKKLKETFISKGLDKFLEFEDNIFTVQEKIEKLLEEI